MTEPMITGRTICWIDDQIDNLEAYVNALRSLGFVVSVAASASEAIALAAKRRFDVFLVDIRMPLVDGIECLRRLKPMQPDAHYATLSSFLYLDRYKEELRRLDFKVELIDKDLPNTESPHFRSSFIDPIIRLATSGVTQTIQVQDALVAKGSSQDPFAIPLQEFERLPLALKDTLRVQAGKLSATLIKEAFADGYIWVLLCGNADVIRVKVRSMDEVMNDDQIMDFATKQNRAPFQFWKSVKVDDNWSPCGAGTQTRFYPTVTLSFGRNRVRVHFDTGSPWTFFSYEELLHLDVIRPTDNFGPSYRAGYEEPYMSTKFKVEALLHCQRYGETKKITITGQAVRDWEAAPFARFCDKSCAASQVGDRPTLCPDRSALIGRNILVENALVIVLDGNNRQTTFLQ